MTGSAKLGSMASARPVELYDFLSRIRRGSLTERVAEDWSCVPSCPLEKSLIDRYAPAGMLSSCLVRAQATMDTAEADEGVSPSRAATLLLLHCYTGNEEEQGARIVTTDEVTIVSVLRTVSLFSHSCPDRRSMRQQRVCRTSGHSLGEVVLCSLKRAVVLSVGGLPFDQTDWGGRGGQDGEKQRVNAAVQRCSGAVSVRRKNGSLSLSLSIPVDLSLFFSLSLSLAGERSFHSDRRGEVTIRRLWCGGDRGAASER